MINSWSLAAEILAGTLDETFPIKKSKSRESSLSSEGHKDECNSQQRPDCLQSLHE